MLAVYKVKASTMHLWSFAFVLLVGASASAQDSNTCLVHAEELCMEPGSDWNQGPCNSIHCGFRGNSANLHQLMLEQFEDSFKFLLLGNHFNSDEVNRMGFHKYLQGYSDKMWGQGKNLMKYILQRGGRMGNKFKVSNFQSEATTEVSSLSALLDTLKSRAEDTNLAHKHAMNKKVHYDNTGMDSYDAGVAHYLEENFVNEYIADIRQVTHKLNTLAKMTRNDKTRAMGLHLFDQSL